MRRFWIAPVLVALIASYGLLPATGSGQAAGLAKKKCHYVTKKVHGKKKRVKICKAVKKPTPTPTPSPTPTSPPQFAPFGIAVDSQGNIFVQHNGAVTKYGQDGTVLGTTGHFLESDKNCAPWGLALSPQGTIYVADECRTASTITAVSSSMQPTWTVSSDPGVAWDNPVVDPRGNIDISSGSAGTIEQISPDGKQRSTLYTISGTDPFTNDPWASAIDPDGNLVITLISSAILLKMSAYGKVLAHSDPLPGYAEIDDIAIDSHGYVYLTAGPGCQCHDAVIKLSPNWQVLGVVASVGTAPGEVNTPLGLAVDTHDNLYVADTFNQRVEKFSPSGQFLSSFTAAP